MKTVLMVAPYFVPRRRVGSLRPYKFAIHLRSHGYQPVILTISNPEPNYTELEEKLLQGIPIIEIEPPFDRTSNQPKKVSENRKKSGFLEWLDKQIPMDSWIILFLLKYLGIRKRIKEYKPDLIWATGDPWSGLWLGEKLAQDFQKPFVADFRDPWTVSDINLRSRSVFSGMIDRHIEKRILRNADYCVFTSVLTESKYADEFSLSDEKTETIYNSFDEQISQHSKDDSWDVELDSNHLNILFWGRFRRLSPVNPIAEALQELYLRNSQTASLIRIHSFGEADNDNFQTIKKNGLEKNFVFHTPVLPEKTIPVLKSADLLLLSTNKRRQYIIPAKLWDYLSVDIPILSITPSAEIAKIITETNAGFHFYPENNAEIASFLEGFAESGKSERWSVMPQEASKTDRNIYEAKHTTQQLAAVFDRLLKNG